MRDTVTPEQIRQYRDQGFVVVENLLTPAELAELRAAVSTAVESMGDTKLNGTRAEGSWKESKEKSFYDRVFLQKINIWKISPTVKRYIAGPEVGAIASSLTGCDLRVWHDQTLQKAPWANPTALHTDNPYHSFYSPQEISIWIALDDTTIQNGCMYFLPGSHKIVTFEGVSIGADFGGIFDTYPALRDIEPVPVPIKAGSCTFHSGLTVHGAGPNVTPRWRRAMTCIYMPVGATFNGNANVLPADRMAKLKVGDALDDDAEHPLITPRSLVGAGK